MSSQKGFTLVEGLLILLVLSVVGFAGYYVWNQQQEESDTAEISQTIEQQTPSTEESPEDSKESVSNLLDTEFFTMKLPVGWEEVEPRFSAGEKYFAAGNSDGAFIEIAVNPGGFGGGGDAYSTVLEYKNNSVELSRDLTYCNPAEDQSGGCRYGDGELFLTYSNPADQEYKGNKYVIFIQDSSGESLGLATPMIDIVETIEFK